MTNPVLVEVTRGSRVESRHRGAVAVVDPRGKKVFSIGDISEPVYPRSAVKAIQALPMVESGAADAFGFRARELALSQASHSGEPEHVTGVTAMLAAVGLDETALECGAHAPTHAGSAAGLIRRGKPPGQLHNNCSGKHANFLAVARHLGIDHKGYVAPKHEVQVRVSEALESLTGAAHGSENCGVDGCSIPTYAIPLADLALGFARFGTGIGLERLRAEAAHRLYQAAVSEPFYVAGTGRADTELMKLLTGAALTKTGAEGVYCAALAGLGLGVAVKADDGAGRASEAIMAAVIARLLPDHADAVRRWTHAPVVTRRGAKVGEVRVLSVQFQARR
jgi:L-asparaginase II